MICLNYIVLQNLKFLVLLLKKQEILDIIFLLLQDVYLVLMKYLLFYNNKVKKIPLNIGEILTSVSLAYWIMSDGGWTGSGIRLFVNSFTKLEVELLINVLNTKFNLHCSIQTGNKSKTQFLIYIPAKDIDHIKSLVLPYMLPSFYYKLGIK